MCVNKWAGSPQNPINSGIRTSGPSACVHHNITYTTCRLVPRLPIVLLQCQMDTYTHVVSSPNTGLALEMIRGQVSLLNHIHRCTFCRKCPIRVCAKGVAIHMTSSSEKETLRIPFSSMNFHNRTMSSKTRVITCDIYIIKHDF